MPSRPWRPCSQRCSYGLLVGKPRHTQPDPSGDGRTPYRGRRDDHDRTQSAQCFHALVVRHLGPQGREVIGAVDHRLELLPSRLSELVDRGEAPLDLLELGAKHAECRVDLLDGQGIIDIGQQTRRRRLRDRGVELRPPREKRVPVVGAVLARALQLSTGAAACLSLQPARQLSDRRGEDLLSRSLTRTLPTFDVQRRLPQIR